MPAVIDLSKLYCVYVTSPEGKGLVLFDGEDHTTSSLESAKRLKTEMSEAFPRATYKIYQLVEIPNDK